MVLFGQRIPFYREVFVVFVVLGQYLRERDEKRFKKYYIERSEENGSSKESKQEKPQKTIKSFENKAQINKIKELKNYFEKCASNGYEILSYTLLCDQFDQGFIEECKKHNVIISQKGGYVFNE